MQTNIFFIVHMTVKLLSAAYILFKTWKYLHSDNFCLWHLFTPPVQEQQVKQEKIQIGEVPDSLVGITKTVLSFAEEPEHSKEEVQIPVRSEPLESETITNDTEDDILSDDVDYTKATKTAEDLLEEEESFFPLDENDSIGDHEFTGGLTFDNISNAVEVIIGNQLAEDKRKEAAETIYEASQTDMFELFVANVSNEEMIVNILNEYLGDTNTVAPQLISRKKERIASFNIETFV